MQFSLDAVNSLWPQDPRRLSLSSLICSDPASEEFRETSVKYVDYRQYQIARAKARYQRSFNYAAGISPRAPPPAAEKRKAPQSVLRVPSEGGAPKRRKEAPVTRKEEVGEKPKVKRVRKKKMRVDETEKGEGEKEGPEREGDESTDEDVPLQKRMKIHADSGRQRLTCFFSRRRKYLPFVASGLFGKKGRARHEVCQGVDVLRSLLFQKANGRYRLLSSTWSVTLFSTHFSVREYIVSTARLPVHSASSVV